MKSWMLIASLKKDPGAITNRFSFTEDVILLKGYEEFPKWYASFPMNYIIQTISSRSEISLPFIFKLNLEVKSSNLFPEMVQIIIKV